MLNALVLIFDGVHLRIFFGFINLLLKLNMYVSSSRCNRFLKFKECNVIISFEVTLAKNICNNKQQKILNL